MHQPRRRVALVAAFLGLSLLSCGRDVTGPENGFPYGRARMAELALAPEFPALPGASLASDVEPFERVRLTLLRLDGTVAKDTLIDFPSTADSLTLALDVPLPLTAPDSGVTMTLSLRYVNAAGDTVFRGGPLPVRVRAAQGGQPAPPVGIPVTWEPNGPLPASVVLLPDTGTVVAGTTTTFTATAFDAGGQPIPGAPILFVSLDTARARVQAPASGVVTWRAVRGPAPIAAFALNGFSDTSRFTVTLPPALVLPVAGTAQTAPVRQALATPVQLRVTAADSVAVAGVRVDFVVATGGGSLTALADTSDANGLVSTGWTLGSALGAQTITATIAGVATSARTITATATEAVPAQLVLVAPPTSGVAGVATPDVVVHVRDATGTTIGTFADTVVGSIVFGPPGQPIPARRRVQAAAGVATFTAPSFELAGRYVIEFSYGALPTVLSDTFTVTAAAAARLLRDSTSGDGQAGLPGAALAQPLRVRVTDAFGNAVAGTVVTWATTGGALAVPTSTSGADGYAANALTLPSVAGPVQVTATAAGLTGSPQAFTLTVSAGAPTQLALVSAIPAITAGQLLPDVVVHARDAAGNLAPTYNGPVFARVLTGPNGPDTDSVTVTAVNGVATFTAQTFETAGTYTVRFNAPGLADAVSPPITVTAGAATQLVVAAFPDSVTTGAPMPPFVLEARDAFGNVDPTFTGTVTASITTGPTGAPIGGTLARAAVAGVATFNDLQLTLVGAYRLGFASGALTPASADLVAWVGAPSGLAIVAGDAQTAPAFATLGDSLAVRVNDLGGNPVPGVATTWSVASGGGSLSSAAVVTGADGRAAVRWTLGGTVGGQTVNVSAGALGPVTFVANATATTANIAWTGATSTSWRAPANWSGGVAPTLADSVLIPAGTPFAPVLDTLATVARLTVAAGATLQLDTLALGVNGTLDVQPGAAITAQPAGAVILTGAGTVRGAVPNLSVQGSFIALAGDLQVGGNLDILAGQLEVGNFDATVSGMLATGNTGRLAMTAAGTMLVQGDAVFAGGSTVGALTAGTLTVRGDFVQAGSAPSSFQAGAGHTVVLDGPATQTVTLLSPDVAPTMACAASCFGTLRAPRAAGTGALAFGSDAKFLGTLEVSGDSLDAAGRTLLAAGAPSVTATVVVARAIGWQSSLVRTGGTFAVDTLVAWGATGTLLAFENRPTIVRGAYAVTGDHYGSITVDGPTASLAVTGRATVGPGLGTALATRNGGRLLMQEAGDTLALNAAAVFGGASAPGDLSAGLLETTGDLSVTNEVDDAFVATGAHRVRLAGTSPVVAFSRIGGNQFQELLIDATASMAFTGNAAIAGTVTLGAGTASVSGTTLTIGGDLVDAVGGRWLVTETIFGGNDPAIPTAIGGSAAFDDGLVLDAPLTTTGDLRIRGGQLALNGFRAQVGGDFGAQGTGVLRMAIAADTLVVLGDATFSGGSTDGQLIDGVLVLHGALTQAGAADAFAASGPHRTVLAGTVPQLLSFATPGLGAGASHFSALALEQGTGGTAVLLTDAVADGMFIARQGTQRYVASPTGQLLTSRGANVAGATFDGVRWTLLDGAPVDTLGAMSFLNQDPAAVQLRIARAGGALTLAAPSFATVPTTGRYLELEDPDLAANGLFTLTVTTPTPAQHGGRVSLLGGALLNGWADFAGLTWTGAASTAWENPGNWSEGRLPTATDSVYFPAGAAQMPVVTIQPEVRALVNDNASPVTMSGGNWLYVRQRLVLRPDVPGVACGTGLVVASPLSGIDTTRVQGRLDCSLRHEFGTVLLTDSLVSTGPLAWLAGSARVVPAGHRLRATRLLVGDAAALVMTDAADTVVADSATFNGAGTAGLLTAGVLQVRGHFTVGANAAAFAASGTHRTEFLPGAADTAQVSVASAATSALAQAYIDRPVRVLSALPVNGDALVWYGGRVIGTTGRLRVGGTLTGVTGTLIAPQVVELGGVLADTGAFRPDTAVFTGTAQVMPFQVGANRVDYRSVRIAGSATLALTGGLDSLTGALIVNGVATASDAAVRFLSIGGGLRVEGPTARLLVNGSAHQVRVHGDAYFDGAASTGDLATGFLYLHGGLVQRATHSPASFAPAATHTTEFLGTTGLVDFATPAQSRLGNLDVNAAGAARTLRTDLEAQGDVQLDAEGGGFASDTLLTAGTRALRAAAVRSYSSTGFTLRNVALRTGYMDVDGVLTFTDFVPTAVQAEISADNGTSFWAGTRFLTTPTGAGRYVRVIDTNAADAQPHTLSVSVSPAIQPAYHLGFAEVVNGAVIDGWPESLSFVWTGAVDGTWTNPANWSGSQVPTATDSVLVPAGLSPNPVVPANTTLRAFVSQRTATPIGLLGNLTITGRLVLPTLGGIACSAGAVQFDNTVTPAVPMAASGRVACFTRLLHGTVVVSDSMTIVGNDVQVENDAVLEVTEDLLTVEGQFSTMNAGVLRMQADSAHVWLQQGATFDGGSTAGQLTAGLLVVQGNFTQGNAGAHGEAFAASGTHVTEISGAQNQQMVFATPGTNAGQSHFHTLAIGQPAGATSITLNSDVYATGALRNGPGPQKFLTAPATVVLATAGAEYGGAAFDNVRWELLDGAPVTGILGGFSFSSMPTGAPQLYIARTGGTIQFTGVTFDVVPTTGAFLQVEDLDGAGNGTLTVSMTGTAPAFHSGRAVLLGGAQLLGWLQDPNFTWTGAVSADWTNPANWSDGVVPTGADSVFVPSGTPFAPLIGADTAVRALTLAAGATLDHEGINLTVNGSVDVGAGGAISGAGGRLNLYGTGAHTLRGAIGAMRIDGGNYALAGGVQVSGLVDIYNGDLAIGGFGLVATGSLYIGQNGTMTMTDPAGVADFAGTVSFNGTSTAGRLTAGLLRVAGDFEQLSSAGGLEDLSFSASGTHVVELVGGATQVIRFDTPDSSAAATCATSCFANLHASKTGGGIRFRTSAKALGNLDLSLPGDSVTAISLAGVPTHLVAGGAARFTAPVLRAGSIAWRDTVATAATTLQVDSLIAWGSDTLLVGFDSVRTVMLGDYRLRGTLAGPLEARAQLDIDGAARVAGSLYTRGPGTLRMTEPTDTIIVEGVSDFGGGATAGLLTAGAYRAGNAFRTTSSGAFAAGGTHRTFFDNLCGLCDGYALQVADSLSRFQWLDITGGNWTIQPASAPIVVNDNLEVRSILQGNPFVRVGGGFFLYGTAQTDLQHLSVAGTVGLRSGFLADTLTFAGTSQSLNTTGTDGAQINYQHVEIRGQVLASPHPTVITSIGSLTVNGGDLLVGNATDTDSTRLQVAGALTTSNGGRLGMQNDLARISTGGNATFAGGSTAGLLTAGRITIGGNFSQSGDAASFSAGGTHVTQFSTEGAQTINFASPGAGASHFHHLEVSQAPSSRVDLLSPVHATGQLRASHGWTTFIRSDAARTLTAGGANLQDIRFDRVALALEDGEAIEGMDLITFDSLPATAVQLRLTRAGGAVLLGQPNFVIAPTGTGRFIVADDPVGNGDDLAVTVDTPTPVVHGGFITQAGAATIAGWDASALINWTAGGGSSAWNDPNNWDAGRVPTFADDVVIPGAAPFAPIISAPEATVVGSLTNQNNNALIVTGDLIVRRSFLNPALSEATVSCDGGTIGFIIEPDSIGQISGAMGNCPVVTTQGTLRVADSTSVASMDVSGTGLLDLNGQWMNVAQGFSTTDRARLRMVNPEDRLVVNGDALFAGESIAATMLDGALRVGGDFTQLSVTNAASFRSQGTSVELFGATPSVVSIDSPGPLQSAFASLVIFKDAGVSVAIDGAGAYTGSLSVSGGILNLNAPSVTTVTGSTNIFGVVNLNTGATLNLGQPCNLIGGSAFFNNLGGSMTGAACVAP